MNLYNEIDPYAAAWLENLIAAGLIAPGIVDRRSIEDITPEELRDFTQCHFFAGIGVWPYALRLAGWPDERRVWTGSCPCQPFSAAGKGVGFADERHLWPAWHHLIRVARPDIVFGEQVASSGGLAWFDLVQADLEAAGYAIGATDFCAAGVGAPHIRQRVLFVAQPDLEQDGGLHGRRQDQGGAPVDAGGREAGSLADAADTIGRPRDAGREAAAQFAGDGGRPGPADGGAARVLADTDGGDAVERALQRGREHGLRAQDRRADGPEGDGERPGLELGDAERPGLEGQPGHGDYPRGRAFPLGSIGASGAVGGFWRDAEVVYCRDGKLRPVEPGTFPLAHGVAARVGRLRAYGNAVVSEVAAAFIRAAMERRP